MEWNLDLCAEVAATILASEWSSYTGEFDVAARAKTIDTLRDKLIRESHLRLNQVQDLAGVRVDLDCTLMSKRRLLTRLHRASARHRTQSRTYG